ncbi:ABC transporter ATP-binding protein [Roseovarius aestuarii]|uniref:Lipopolysaccharide export system ATP-binding protein LptB n=1 Tax=Roseovarius aestuarii TaxID=475083 RepID=A0A1X7BNP3_9RHOB|nr:ABC transporter ATP-binding protein [Roseovarius aestuarii]SMC11233.1 Lipopolysaccharide export system ATP-binding protein LptB [Roseovarius aestuarii]
MTPILDVKSLTKRFGGLTAVNALDLTVRTGEIHGVIGPNGAGKTTLFSLIAGAMRPTSGQVFFDGTEITTWAPHKITEAGLARTFQRSAVYHGFSVLENMLISMHTGCRVSLLGAIFNFGPTFPAAEIEQADGILEFVGLSEYRDAQAETLALGHQRSLGIAIALATGPRLLMLDEPAAGMNAQEAVVLDELIRKIRDDQGISVVLVEHDMKLVMEICDRITAINFGLLLANGTPEEIAGNNEVIDAYLGVEDLLDEDGDHA